MDLAAGIDQHHVAILQHLRMLHPMREGTRGTEQDDAEGRTGRAHLAVRLVDELGDFGGADAFAENARRGLLHFQGHVLGPLHQRQLLGRLAHPPWSISGAALTKFLPGASWRKRSNMPNGRLGHSTTVLRSPTPSASRRSSSRR